MIEWLQKILSDFWGYLMPFVTIDPFEEGVRVRLGKYTKVLKSGTYIFPNKIPFIDYVYTAVTKPDTKELTPIYITTTDGETIVITPVIGFEITDIHQWLMEANEPHSNLYDIAGMVTADVVTDMTWEEVKKKSTYTKIKNKINSQIEHLGATVNKFGLKNIAKCRIIITKLDGQRKDFYNSVGA